MTRDSAFWLRGMLIASLSIVIASAASAEETKERLARGVLNNYKTFSQFPNLRIDHELKYVHLSGVRRFAFKDADIVFERKGKKLRVEVRSSIGAPPKPFTRLCSWDGAIGMTYHGRSIALDIDKNAPTNIFGYSYYVNFMYYPEGDGKEEALFNNRDEVDADYWISESLSKHLDEYRVAPTREVVDGVECVLLERPGYDRIWIDPGRGFVVRRREVRYPTADRLRERTTYGDFRPVAGLHLPFSIVREEFAGLDDSNLAADQLRGRKSIIVRDISVGVIPDKEFRLPIPEDQLVADHVRNLTYKNLAKGDDPSAQVLDVARRDFSPPPRSGSRGIVVAILLGSMLAIGIVLRMFLKSRRA